MKKLLITAVSALALTFALGVTAFAAEDQPKEPSLQILTDSSDRYKDIKKSAWYKSAVDGVYYFGLIDGITVNTFCPDETTDRATLVTALYRMTGEPEVSKEVPFTDLSEDWYKNAVAWAYETGVVNGTSATAFSPDAKITREQMAAIFFRYMSYMGGNIESASDLDIYPDAAKVNSWAKDAFSWACAEGLITGSTGSDGVVRLAPAEGATRAQVATIVMRFCQRYQSIFDTKDDPAEDNRYKTFKSEGNIGHTESNFGSRKEESVLTLDHSRLWTFTKADGVYIIKDKDGEIGRLYSGAAPDLKKWKIVDTASKKNGTTTIYRYIEKYGSGVTLSFRYRFSFERTIDGTAHNYTLVLDYAKIKDSSAQRILDYSKIDKIYTDQGYGKLSNLKDKYLYFVGNSFIGYSYIDSILEEMSEKSGYDLKIGWKWIPNSRIVDFSKDPGIMSRIKSGSYDAVFLCGMYAADDVDAIKDIVYACQASGVQLILLPAHNENASVIEMVQNKYPTIPIINWKEELEALIGEGRSFWSFCYNDGVNHSNKIAGYVGAHMIFRAIYGKNPSVTVSEYVSQGEVNGVLGSYVSKARARIISVPNVNYFD